MKRFSNVFKAKVAPVQPTVQPPAEEPPVVLQTSVARKITKEEMLANMPKKLLKPAK